MHDWSNSFNKNDEKSCDYEFYNLVGFERDGTDNLQGIKKPNAANEIEPSGTNRHNVRCLTGSGR